MRQIIEGAKAEYPTLPLNAAMILWLTKRTGRTGTLQDLMAAYAQQQGVRSVNELPPVLDPNRMSAVKHANEQRFHGSRLYRRSRNRKR